MTSTNNYNSSTEDLMTSLDDSWLKFLNLNGGAKVMKEFIIIISDIQVGSTKEIGYMAMIERLDNDIRLGPANKADILRKLASAAEGLSKIMDEAKKFHTFIIATDRVMQNYKRRVEQCCTRIKEAGKVSLEGRHKRSLTPESHHQSAGREPHSQKERLRNQEKAARSAKERLAKEEMDGKRAAFKRDAEIKLAGEQMARKKAKERLAKRNAEERLAKKNAEERLAKKKAGEQLARKKAEERLARKRAASKRDVEISEASIAKVKAAEERLVNERVAGNKGMETLTEAKTAKIKAARKWLNKERGNVGTNAANLTELKAGVNVMGGLAGREFNSNRDVEVLPITNRAENTVADVALGTNGGSKMTCSNPVSKGDDFRQWSGPKNMEIESGQEPRDSPLQKPDYRKNISDWVGEMDGGGSKNSRVRGRSATHIPDEWRELMGGELVDSGKVGGTGRDYGGLCSGMGEMDIGVQDAQMTTRLQSHNPGAEPIHCDILSDDELMQETAYEKYEPWDCSGDDDDGDDQVVEITKDAFTSFGGQKASDVFGGWGKKELEALYEGYLQFPGPSSGYRIKQFYGSAPGYPLVDRTIEEISERVLKLSTRNSYPQKEHDHGQTSRGSLWE